MDYIVLALVWIAWCAGHSALVSLRVTGWARGRLGGGYRYYRLAYNAFAMATLAAAVHYGAGLKGPVLFAWDGWWLPVRAALAVAAAGLFVAGGRQYDLLYMLGVRQLQGGGAPEAAPATLNTAGILAYVRHPWYLGAILAVWASEREIHPATLLVNVILTVYVVIGTALEERKLVAEFGEAYRQYREKVPMLVPRLRKKN